MVLVEGRLVEMGGGAVVVVAGMLLLLGRRVVVVVVVEVGRNMVIESMGWDVCCLLLVGAELKFRLAEYDDAGLQSVGSKRLFREAGRNGFRLLVEQFAGLEISIPLL